MTTMTVASSFLYGGGATREEDFFEESLSPERVQQSIRNAFLVPTRINQEGDPNELLARAMIARQEAVSAAVEPDEGGWFDVATSALTAVGQMGRMLATGLMLAGRKVIRMLAGVVTTLVRTMVRVVWFGLRTAFRFLMPFIVSNPLLAAAITASIAGYITYRSLKNKEAGIAGGTGEWQPRTVETTAQDIDLEGAKRTGQEYKGGSSTKVGSPPKLPDHVVALANKTADRYGIDRADFLTYIAIESGGKNVSRGEKGAKGLLQFIPSTAKMYGIAGEEMDEAKNLDAGARLYLDNARFLKGKGVAPTITNLYLAHQQGSGAVKKLLDAAAAGLRVDDLPDTLRKNVRNNMYGKSEYVHEYVGSTQAKLTKWSSMYAGLGGSSTQAVPPSTPTAAEATKDAVDSQVKAAQQPAAAVIPPPAAAQRTGTPNPVRLPNGVVVDADS